MKRLGILVAAAAFALACERADRAVGTAGEQAQTFSEAAGELASDVAADVSAAANDAGEETRQAADAIEEAVQ